MKSHLPTILVIFLATVSLSLPLLRPGLHQIHDDQQIARLFLFDQSLKSGQFPVRWVDSLGFGYGYPLFVFYPPFVYMLGETFHLVGFGFIDSVKLVFFASIFFSGVTIYILAREFWGKMPAVVSALFYMFVPYRALDIYVRGALAESFSFVWLPLVFWSFYKLTITHKQIYIYLSAIFLALLMITHNLIFLPLMLILPFYLLFLIWKSPNRKLSIVNCQLSIVIALALSAFFWLPALLEKKYTIVDQLLLVNLANYNIHFVYPQQLWNWPWGFGGSAAGLADGISFKIGKLHILVSIAALVFAIIHLRFKKLSTVNCQRSTVFFSLLLFSAFMTTYYSKPIWDLLPSLAYLQFPWRFLTFTAFFSSLLAGAFIYFLRLPILKLIALPILMTLLVIPNFKLFKPQSYRLDLTDQKATSPEVINWYVSSSSFEYLPKGVELYKGSLGTNLVKIDKEQIPKSKVEANPNIQVSDIISSPTKIEFKAFAKEQNRIKVNVFNFPGWQAQVDGQIVPVTASNRLKLLEVDIPQGTHQVKIEFKETMVRLAANLISFISILSLFLLITKWPKTATT